MAMSAIWESEMFMVRSELSVATFTVRAVTSTEVLTSPTSSRISFRSNRSWVDTLIPFCSCILKPGCEIVRV